MALDQQLKEQVSALFASLKSKFTFKIYTGSHAANNAELLGLLEEVAACSDKISLEQSAGSQLSFSILKDGQENGISFRAIPNGHEFTTLLLAVLNQGGIGKNLPDEVTTQRIQNISSPVKLRSYISLSCTNCPDVVQALNIFCMLNPNISHEIIDGGINQEEVAALNIQAVPSVYIGDEAFHIGRSSLGELLSKLEELSGTSFKLSNAGTKAYDVVVAGGGPAGASAAIYAARKGFRTAIVADNIGGQVAETVEIENLISTPKTTGSQLAADLKKHIAEYEIDVLENRLIEHVELEEGYKIVQTASGEKLKTPALIIATGASWRKLGVPGENDYIGAGVAFCTHCDGPFYKGKKVAVVGGGNSGLEAAIDLSAIATNVVVLEFADSLKADKVLQDKAQSLDNVTILTNVATTELLGNGSKLTGLKYENRESKEVTELALDGVFVQIGLTANSSAFSSLVQTNRMGEIAIDANCRTNVPGVYAAGDVSEVSYKQIIIAMGEGAKAALSAFDDSIKNELLA